MRRGWPGGALEKARQLCRRLPRSGQRVRHTVLVGALLAFPQSAWTAASRHPAKAQTAARAEPCAPFYLGCAAFWVLLLNRAMCSPPLCAAFWVLLLLNSAMAWAANLTNFLVTKHTSALTLQARQPGAGCSPPPHCAAPAARARARFCCRDFVGLAPEPGLRAGLCRLSSPAATPLAVAPASARRRQLRWARLPRRVAGPPRTPLPLMPIIQSTR